MKPINEFTENDGILINNEQESQEIRELLHGMGLKWYSEDSYLEYKGQLVFPIVIFPKKGSYTIDFEKDDKRIAYPASDYIIKAGDDVDGLWCDIWFDGETYIGKSKSGIFITEGIKSGNFYKRNAVRKAPNPKAKAIAEIKKIAEENGIEVKIL
jgi:hypothetical protein